MRGVRSFVAAGVALALLTAGTACSDDDAPEHPSWAQWRADHDVPGVRVDSAERGSERWDVDATLRVAPTPASVRRAATALCAFARVAAATPDLRLTIGSDDLDLGDRCRGLDARLTVWALLHDERHVVAASLDIAPSITLDVDDVAVASRVHRLLRGWPYHGFRGILGPHLVLRTETDAAPPGVALDRAARTSRVAGSRLRQVVIDEDDVSVTIAGPASGLPALRHRLPGVEVTSSVDLPAGTPAAVRDAATRLSLDEGVVLVERDVDEDRGDPVAVSVLRAGDADHVAGLLAEPGLRPLRPVDLVLPGPPGAAGLVCTVRVRFPDRGHVAAVRRLCRDVGGNRVEDLGNTITVFDLDVDVDELARDLHSFPDGTVVVVDRPDPKDTDVRMVLGPRLRFLAGGDTRRADQVRAAWER